MTFSDVTVTLLFRWWVFCGNGKHISNTDNDNDKDDGDNTNSNVVDDDDDDDDGSGGGGDCGACFTVKVIMRINDDSVDE